MLEAQAKHKTVADTQAGRSSLYNSIMCNKERSGGRESYHHKEPDKQNEFDLEKQLTDIQERIYNNEANENIIERTRIEERLIEEYEAILSDMTNAGE